MKLSNLIREPQLTPIQLDSEEIIEQYGEPLEFYMWDRHPMNTFLKLASLEDDMTQAFDVLKEMVFDEKGKPLFSGKALLPPNVTLELINKVISELGNSAAQTTAK